MTRAIMFGVIVCITILLASGAEAACPMGSFPSVDQWGNSVCQRYNTGTPSTIEGSLERCPMGSYPSVDSWGNRVCRQPNSGSGGAYDTSRGCPMGFFPSVDQWG